MERLLRFCVVAAVTSINHWKRIYKLILLSGNWLQLWSFPSVSESHQLVESWRRCCASLAPAPLRCVRCPRDPNTVSSPSSSPQRARLGTGDGPSCPSFGDVCPRAAPPRDALEENIKVARSPRQGSHLMSPPSPASICIFPASSLTFYDLLFWRKSRARRTRGVQPAEVGAVGRRGVARRHVWWRSPGFHPDQRRWRRRIFQAFGMWNVGHNEEAEALRGAP